MNLLAILELGKIQDAERQQALSQAPYYPEVFLRDDGRTARIAALVRIEREGKWYAIPVYDIMIYRSDCDATMLWRKFIHNCYLIQTLYKLTGKEQLDFLQISEEERFKHLKK